MIDAGPSLEAAGKISASTLAAYLKSTGWKVEETAVPEATILSKWLPGADDPVHIVLPAAPDFNDERRRVADALRTLQVVEERPIATILEEVRQTAHKSDITRDVEKRPRP
jgi:L-lactate utilization protein LutB